MPKRENRVGVEIKMTSTKEYLNKGQRIFPTIKTIAKEYYDLTQRPLGVTGEVAEYEAIKILKLEVCEARQEGYDATLGKEKIQIKGRVIHPNSKSSQRISTLRRDKEWTSVILVIMNEQFDPTEMYKAKRKDILEFMDNSKSKAVAERGQLSINSFKKIAGNTPIWSNKKK